MRKAKREREGRERETKRDTGQRERETERDKEGQRDKWQRDKERQRDRLPIKQQQSSLNPSSGPRLDIPCTGGGGVQGTGYRGVSVPVLVKIYSVDKPLKPVVHLTAALKADCIITLDKGT